MTRLKLAVLISGGGTTLKNLLDKQSAGELAVEFCQVISSNPQAGGLAFASEAGIPSATVRRKDFATPELHSEAIFGRIRECGAEWVLMGGFLSHVLIPADFENRVINTHPSLIPSFCGKGYYGLRVHQSVLDFGAKITGCTIHFVDNQYDHGPIIMQRAVTVLDADTAESLQQRVFAEECVAIPDVLRLLAAGKLEMRGRRVVSG